MVLTQVLEAHGRSSHEDKKGKPLRRAPRLVPECRSPHQRRGCGRFETQDVSPEACKTASGRSTTLWQKRSSERPYVSNFILKASQHASRGTTRLTLRRRGYLPQPRKVDGLPRSTVVEAKTCREGNLCNRDIERRCHEKKSRSFLISIK